jgi:cellulase/cellobiase CelA1
MIGSTSSDSTVTSYAVKTSTGVNLMLVNHSAQTSEPVAVTYDGFNAGSVTSAQQFSEANKALRPISGVDAHALTLPPYSTTVLKLSGASAGSGSGSTHTASCTVTTSTGGSWYGGYVENVRITNNGPATTGWKITFDLPAKARVTSSWNLTHSQDGTTVTAQAVSYDKTIAAGGTLPFGFVTAGSGKNVAQPAWYALTGVRCGSN